MIRPGRLLAGAVIVALATGVVVAANTDRSDRGQAAAPVPVATTPPDGQTTTTTTIDDVVVAPASTTTAREPRSVPLVVVEEGLAAWGRFAVDGDLEEVAPWFHPDGPQWERFKAEEPELVGDPLGGPPYATALEEIRVEQAEEEASVTAKVTFVRTGEPSQTFRWEFLLRQSTGEWRIWTVADQLPPSSTSIP